MRVTHFMDPNGGKKKCDGKNTGQSRLTAENTPRFGRCHTNRLSWIGIRPTFVPGRPKHANLDLCGRFFFRNALFGRFSEIRASTRPRRIFGKSNMSAREILRIYSVIDCNRSLDAFGGFLFKIFTDDITHFRQCRKSLWTSLFQMEWNNDRTAGDRRGEGGDVNADLHCSSEYDIKLGT